jgi:hypothetical protein
MAAPSRDAPADAIATSDADLGTVKSLASGPTVGGPRRSRRGWDGISRPCQGSLAGAEKHSVCVRKVRKVGKVLSVMTRTPFLTFLTFLSLGPQKKAAG